MAFIDRVARSHDVQSSGIGIVNASSPEVMATAQSTEGALTSLGMHHAAVRYLSWSSALLLSQLYTLEQVNLYQHEVAGITADTEWRRWASSRASTAHRSAGSAGVGGGSHSTHHPGTAGSAATSPTPSAASQGLSSNARALAFVLVYVNDAPFAASDGAGAAAPTDACAGAQVYQSVTDAFEDIYFPTHLLAASSVASSSSASAHAHGSQQRARAGRGGAPQATTSSMSANNATAGGADDEELPLPSEVREAFRLFIRLAQQCVLPALQLLLVRRRRRMRVPSSRAGEAGSAKHRARDPHYRHHNHRRDEVDSIETGLVYAESAAHGYGKDDYGAPLFLDEPAGEQAASCVFQLLLGLAFSCPCASLAAAAQLVLAEALAHLERDDFDLHSLHGFLRGLPELVRTTAGVADPPSPGPAPGRGHAATAASPAGTAGGAGRSVALAASRAPSTLPPLPHSSSNGAVGDADGTAGAELEESYLVALEKAICQEQDRLRVLTPPRLSTASASGTTTGSTPATLHLRPDVDELVWVEASGRICRQSLRAWLDARRHTPLKSEPTVLTRAVCAPLPSTTVLSTIQRLVLPAAPRDVGAALHLQATLDEAVETNRSAHNDVVRRSLAVPGATKALRRKKLTLPTGPDRGAAAGQSTAPAGESGEGQGAAEAALPRRLQLFRTLAEGQLFLTRPMRMSANEILFQSFADGGECPGYYHLLALEPEVLKAHHHTSAHLFAGEGPLPVDLRLMLAVMIASRHRCEYLVGRYSALLIRYGSMALQPQYAPPAAVATTVGGGAAKEDGSAGVAATAVSAMAADANTKAGEVQPPTQQSIYDDVEEDIDAVSVLYFGTTAAADAQSDGGRQRKGIAGGGEVISGSGTAAAGTAGVTSDTHTAQARRAQGGYVPSAEAVRGTQNAAGNGGWSHTARSHPPVEDGHNPAGGVETSLALPTTTTTTATSDEAPLMAQTAVKDKERWLTQGPPARLLAAQRVIALAAHTPWLLTEADVRALLQQGWTVPELFQLMAIIAHVLPLCSFVMGMYVVSEPWVSAVLPLSVSRRLKHNSVANNAREGVGDDWPRAGDATAVSRSVPVAPRPQKPRGTSPRSGDVRRGESARHDADESDSEDASSGPDTDSDDEDEDGANPSHRPRDLYVLYAGETSIVSEQRIKGTATNHHALWRSQFNWFELGTTLMEQYYPGAAGLLNAEMDAVLDLSRRLSEVDCVGLKTGPYTPEYALRSLQLYVCNLLGYMTEDYPYNDINKVLRRPAKWFAQVLTVRPEILTRDDVVRWHAALSTPSGGGGGPSVMTATSTSNNQSTIASATVASAATGRVAVAVSHAVRRENELLALATAAAATGTGTATTAVPTVPGARAHAPHDGARRSQAQATSSAGTRRTGTGRNVFDATSARSSQAEGGDRPAGQPAEPDTNVPDRQLEEAVLLQTALSLQDEHVLWLTALTTMEARREGLLHILMHPLCSVLQNL